MAGGPTSHTPVFRGRDYDGNGKLSPIEVSNGKRLEKHSDGKGFRVVGSHDKKLANIQDSSFTKQLAEIDQLKKELTSKDKRLEDAVALIKDMDKRLKEIESKKGDK